MNSVETPATKHVGVPIGAAESQLLHSSLMAIAHANGDASSGPPALATTPTLSALLHAIKRRWALAIGIALSLAVAFGVAVFFFHPPKYHATLEMRIVAKQAGPEDIEFPIFKASMETMVKNPIVLSNALNDKTPDGREIKDLDVVRSRGMGAIEWLRKNLKTDYLLGPEVLRVTLPADNAEEAAALLNAISKAFHSEYAELERGKKQVRLAELRGKKDLIERDLASLRNVLDRDVKQLELKDPSAVNVQQSVLQSNLAAGEAALRSINNEIAVAESDIFTSKARLKNIDKQPIPEEVLYDAYSKDQILMEFDKRLAEIERLIIDYSRKYPEEVAQRLSVPLKHEKIQIREAKKEFEVTLRPAVEERWRKSVIAQLHYRIELAEDKLVTAKPLREKEEKNVFDLRKKLQDAGLGILNEPPHIQQTRQNIHIATRNLEMTAQEINRIEIEPLVSRVIPIQQARPPLDKDRSQQTKIAGAGGLGVFMLALFAVGFLEFRSRKIDVADEVTSGLGLNVLGTVPAMPRRPRKATAKDQGAEEKWLAQLQESVDAIRTVILHHARSESLHVLMVTSAQSGEGKTTLATQLAASLARAWKRTLVIDADLRHPGAHVLFDTPQEPGLAEVLRGEVEAADTVRATAVSRLWLLPAGNGDAHAIQALAQDNIRTLFEQLKQQYDFIIIDTPPLLPVADTLLIGQHVDGAVFAILRDVSRAPAIYAAQQKIAPLNVRTLGAVVLGAQNEFEEKPYGYAKTQGAK